MANQPGNDKPARRTTRCPAAARAAGRKPAARADDLSDLRPARGSAGSPPGDPPGPRDGADVAPAPKPATRPTGKALCGLRRKCVGDAPKTPGDLHRWLSSVAAIEVPREALIDGHAAPFDYLCHAFFEKPAPGADQRPPEGAPRDCVVWACRGGGKTFYGAVATMLDLVFKPGIEVCALGGSREQSERMYAHLRRLFEIDGLKDLLDGRPTRRRLMLLCGSTCEVSAASETSVRGRRPQKMRCDEVELFDPDIWRAAQLAPRSRKCGGAWVRAAVEALSTMHRPGGLMAALVRSASLERPGARTRALFRWGVVDVLAKCEPEAVRPCAPCALLPECAGRAKRDAWSGGHIAIDDAAEMKRRVGREQWESEMLCLRPSSAGLVFAEFERAIHVFDGEAPAEGATVLCGMDFGFRDPTVILWALVDDAGVVHIVDERVETEARLESHIRAMLDGNGRAWAKPAWVGADPAGRQRSKQTGLSDVGALRKAGLNVRARRAPIEVGLSVVRARLAPAAHAPPTTDGTPCDATPAVPPTSEGSRCDGPLILSASHDPSPRLFIHARCVKLIESLETYRYPEEGASREPEKTGADHAADALRYLILNLDRPEKSERGNWM